MFMRDEDFMSARPAGGSVGSNVASLEATFVPCFYTVGALCTGAI